MKIADTEVERPVIPEGQAATMLGVSRAALRRWRRERRGPRFLKVGRLVRYRRADIEAYLTKHAVETSEGSDRVHQ